MMNTVTQKVEQIQAKGDDAFVSDHTELSLNDTEQEEYKFDSKDASGKFMLMCDICQKSSICPTDMS
jgi:hypothetical protein